MIGYTIKPNEDDLASALSLFEFVGGNTTEAVKVAINKTLSIAKTKSASAIGEEVNLTASYIKGKLTPIKATKYNLIGRIRAESRGLLLSKFEHGAKVSLIGGRLTPDKPIKVKVNKGAGQIKPVVGGKDIVGKPFYFRLKNSKDGLSYGIGGFRKESGPRGGRFKAFYTTSVSQVFKNVKDDITPEVEGVYQRQLVDAMRYVLQKKYPKE